MAEINNPDDQTSWQDVKSRLLHFFSILDTPWFPYVFALIVLIAAGIWIFKPGVGTEDKSGDLDTASRRIRTAATVLGEYITNEVPDARVVLVVPPENSTSVTRELVDDARTGLKKGLNEKAILKKVDSPKFTKQIAKKLLAGTRREMPDLSRWCPPVNRWLNVEIFERVLWRNSDCNVLVSMVGLPKAQGKDMEQFLSALEYQYKQTGIAVLRGPLVKPEYLRKGFKQESFLAAILRGKCESILLTLGQVEGRLRGEQTLVTSKNVKQILNNCPDIIKQPKAPE